MSDPNFALLGWDLPPGVTNEDIDRYFGEPQEERDEEAYAKTCADEEDET